VNHFIHSRVVFSGIVRRKTEIDSAIVEEASLRVVVDLVLTNGSMLGAAVIWALFKPALFSENPWCCPTYH